MNPSQPRFNIQTFRSLTQLFRQSAFHVGWVIEIGGNAIHSFRKVGANSAARACRARMNVSLHAEDEKMERTCDRGQKTLSRKDLQLRGWLLSSDFWFPASRNRIGEIVEGQVARVRDLLASIVERILACATAEEVLVIVVRRISQFDHRGPGAFRAWLRRILAKHILKHFRDRAAS